MGMSSSRTCFSKTGGGGKIGTGYFENDNEGISIRQRIAFGVFIDLPGQYPYAVDETPYGSQPAGCYGCDELQYAYHRIPEIKPRETQTGYEDSQ
jgi:hypothetical protein